MSPQRVFAVVVGLLLAGAATWMLWISRSPTSGTNAAVLLHPLQGSATPDLGARTLPVADPSAYAELNSNKTTALQDVHIVEALLQNMQQSLKTAAVPPLGFNEEISRALTGRNPLELAFIPSTHSAINARGLLCDRWGTPFHFHPIASDRIDVRSAGADKKLFTADDIVSSSPQAVSGGDPN